MRQKETEKVKRNTIVDNYIIFPFYFAYIQAIILFFSFLLILHRIPHRSFHDYNFSKNFPIASMNG